jgi:hypothetical protein
MDEPAPDQVCTLCGRTGHRAHACPWRKPASIFDAPTRHRPNWPFLYFSEDNRWYVNRAKRRSKAAEAADLGEAKW